MSKPQSKPTQTEPDDIFGDLTVVDGDVHIDQFYAENGLEEIAQYMDEPYASYLTADDASYPVTGWSKTLGGKKELIAGDATTPEAIQAELVEGLGVDHPIINRFSRLDMVMRRERALEEMEATNNLLLDKFLDDYDHFLGLASVAARAPDKAAEEIDRMGDEDQMVGVFLQAGDEFQKPLGDPELDVMYQAMEDNGMHPVYHATIFDDKAPGLREFQTAFARVGPIWGGMYELASLIENGVPEKFPDLSFVFAEYGGLSWVPIMMGKLNREYGQFTSEVPLLEQSPEEYMRDQFYFGTQPLEEFNDPQHMKHIIDIVGTDNICFTTDFPHHDFDNPTTIDQFLQQLDPEDRQKVLGGNLAEALELDLAL